MQLRCLSTAALEFVRKSIVPLPSDVRLRAIYSFIHSVPGLNVPSFEYLKALVPKMKIPGEFCSTLIFDEVKISETAQLDTHFDMVLGPNKYVNQVMIRSITGEWKLPILCTLDTAISKAILFKLILFLEGIGLHVLISVCDMGPRNTGLARDLNISPENPIFQNPANPDRNILFSYDWVHCIKLLR